MKKFKIILLLVGLVIFGLLIQAIGIEVIGEYIVVIKWNWIQILIPFFFVYIFDTLGWKYSFRKDSHSVGYGTLFVTRLAGEAINYITPTAYMGGEPIKARLLKKKGISSVDALASVVIAKTTMTIAQIIFVISGLVIASFYFVLPMTMQIGAGISILFIGGLVMFLVSQQKKGLFVPILDFLKKYNIIWLEKKREKIESLDKSISLFYHSNKSYFLLSIFFHLIGWIVGFFEVYLIVKSVGVSISFPAAFVVESLFVVVKAVFFIIPGSLGAQEGGTILIFSTLGFGTSVGLTVGIVKRIREMIWIAIGLAILARYELLDVAEVSPNPQ